HRFVPSAEKPVHERRADRQFGGGKRERLARQRLVDAIHFIQDLPGHDLADVVLGIALAVAHPHLGRLTRHRLVRKDADPDSPAALDVTRHRAPRRLDLPRRQPPAADGLETIFAKADLGADGSHTLVAALLLLAVLPSSW